MEIMDVLAERATTHRFQTQRGIDRCRHLYGQLTPTAILLNGRFYGRDLLFPFRDFFPCTDTKDQQTNAAR